MPCASVHQAASLSMSVKMCPQSCCLISPFLPGLLLISPVAHSCSASTSRRECEGLISGLGNEDDLRYRADLSHEIFLSQGTNSQPQHPEQQGRRALATLWPEREGSLDHRLKAWAQVLPFFMVSLELSRKHLLHLSNHPAAISKAHLLGVPVWDPSAPPRYLGDARGSPWGQMPTALGALGLTRAQPGPHSGPFLVVGRIIAASM